MEQGLRELPLPLAFVRAGGFYENYLHGLQAGQGGTLPVFSAPTDRAIAMIATKDIGVQIAKLLTGSAWTGLRIVELGSMVAPDKVAEQLGDVLGRPVKAELVPRVAWVDALEHMGIPRGETWAFEEMNDAINSGWIHFGVDGTERVPATTTAREVFADAKKRPAEPGSSGGG